MRIKRTHVLNGRLFGHVQEHLEDSIVVLQLQLEHLNTLSFHYVVVASLGVSNNPLTVLRCAWMQLTWKLINTHDDEISLSCHFGKTFHFVRSPMCELQACTRTAEGRRSRRLLRVR